MYKKLCVIRKEEELIDGGLKLFICQMRYFRLLDFLIKEFIL